VAIKKILNIKNIGRFVSCAQKGPEFRRFNFIFAENGRGKTTLCAIWRSLQTGDPAHIVERKTISPTPGDPAAEVRVDGATARFNANAWSQQLPEIAIFDSTFVAQNVHAGEHVDRDHRANLLQVIIGEQGVNLAARINTLDDTIRSKNGDITNSRRALQQHLPVGVSVETCLALPEDATVDTQLAAVKEQLTAAKRAGEIGRRAALAEVVLPELPPTFAAGISATLDTVAADAEERIRRHVEAHEMGARGLGWLEEGAGFIHGDDCPFCGQGVAAVQLVGAYKQFFSAEYATLLRQLRTLQSDIASRLGEAALAALERTIATNAAAIEFWVQFDAVELPTLDVAVVAEAVRATADSAGKLVGVKLANPLETVARPDAFDNALALLDKTVEQLKTYNAAVGVANSAIAKIKVGAAASDVAALERQVASLTVTKLRYSSSVKPLCDELIRLQAEKRYLDLEKADAKTALDSHADTMIRDYETSINALLTGFGAGFLLTNSRKSYIGGTPTSSYQILINGQAVDLGDSSTPTGTASFRTTLSAGDKSTLALAFFLARLDHDAGKASRIVVFDDPFNSQDRSRRERTAELLKKYGTECAQLFLLSHDPHFLHLVFSKAPRADRHSLQLSRTPGNATSLEEWDVEEETKDGYFREHAALASYLLNGGRDLISIVRKIRPVLEGYLRYRFPNQFPPNLWLGDMIGHIRTTGSAHPMYDALAELTAINDYSKKFHHDTNPGAADSERIDDGELQQFVQRTLTIAGGY